ncbi:MAG TPA: substrate-binding domain-containing protein [Gemmatimonadaceae bacterium]|nr:substrate-binding domain-containing protein [Gemmatimonadaceae bacterium]
MSANRTAALLALATTLGCAREPAATLLRVCADPNNLPFSDSTGAGFENRLATLVAGEMKATVTYTWWAQRRGFVRNTLNANRCDVVMGVPTSFELTGVTRPYYRSSYVFVSRRDRDLRVRSFNDSVLRHVRVGVQLVGDDYANAPPAHALANRGIVENVHGYNVQGDYRRPSPPARIIDAVANGDVDIAVAWGPLAGYFATREPVPLEIVPVSPQVDLPFLPFVFDISMGVRRADSTLRDTLNAILLRRRASIDSLLDAYGVPLLNAKGRVPTVTASRDQEAEAPR